MEERPAAATTQISPRRRKALTEPRSVKAVPGRQKAAVPASLIKGQIWKVKDTYVQIVDAGKTLIHYTMSPKPRQRGLRVHMATRETVQDFLKSNQATLMS
jgi:hypothetical protein